MHPCEETRFRVIPLSEGWCARVKWLLSWPVNILLRCTIPDCNLPQWERWYLLTFLSSTLWIALFSYLMVWMVWNSAAHQHINSLHLPTYTQHAPCVLLSRWLLSATHLESQRWSWLSLSWQQAPVSPTVWPASLSPDKVHLWMMFKHTCTLIWRPLISFLRAVKDVFISPTT